MLILKRVTQLVLVINRARFVDAVCANRFAHSVDINVGRIARHVNGDDAKAIIPVRFAPLGDARQVLFADAAAHRPEMNQRQSGCRAIVRLAIDPLGRAV